MMSRKGFSGGDSVRGGGIFRLPTDPHVRQRFSPSKIMCSIRCSCHVINYAQPSLVIEVLTWHSEPLIGLSRSFNNNSTPFAYQNAIRQIMMNQFPDAWSLLIFCVLYIYFKPLRIAIFLIRAQHCYKPYRSTYPWYRVAIYWTFHKDANESTIFHVICLLPCVVSFCIVTQYILRRRGCSLLGTLSYC